MEIQNAWLKAMTAAALCMGLAGCGGNGDSVAGSAGTGSAINPSEVGSNSPATPSAYRVVVNSQNPDYAGVSRTFQAPVCSQSADTPRAGGGVYSIHLTSASGYTIAFSVFEPKNFDCSKGNPLVFHGHGFGGSRETTPTGLLKRLVDNGIGVISIDQRGFGESTGSVRVLDPDYEGQDLLQILDWAEAHLDWLRYRNDKPVGNRQYNAVMGSTGGSYGGGYQLLIHNIDPWKRLDALTPDITWNDLRYSLNPGGAYGIKDFKPADGEVTPQGVVKTGWDALLAFGGEEGSIAPKVQAGNFQAVPSSGLDNLIRETLVRGVAANRFPAGALEFFRYHSASYFCDDEVAGTQSFLQGTLTPKYPQTKPDPVDILFSQGFRDSLFNFNEAWRNFQCYRNLVAANGGKGDVRLITHQNGHILPVSAYGQPVVGDLAEQGAQNGLNTIEFQRPAGPRACGDLSVDDADFAFLVSKLLNADESAAIAKQDTTGAFQTLAANQNKICVSMNDDVGQTKASAGAATWIPVDQFATHNAPAMKGGNTDSLLDPVTFKFDPQSDPTSAATSGVLGLLRDVPAPAAVPVYIPASDVALAGIATGTVSITPTVAQLSNPACTQILAGASQSPVGLLGVDPACDPIVFLGLGVYRNNAWRLIDDQPTAVRGFGTRHVELNGVAEHLKAGEKLAILVYGYSPQYPVSGSRDPLSPVVVVQGTLNLPIAPFGGQ